MVHIQTTDQFPIEECQKLRIIIVPDIIRTGDDGTYDFFSFHMIRDANPGFEAAVYIFTAPAIPFTKYVPGGRVFMHQFPGVVTTFFMIKFRYISL
ncbi:hypothetical protein D3C74_423280 [compost metagenome]